MPFQFAFSPPCHLGGQTFVAQSFSSFLLANFETRREWLSRKLSHFNRPGLSVVVPKSGRGSGDIHQLPADGAPLSFCSALVFFKFLRHFWPSSLELHASSFPCLLPVSTHDS